MALPETIGDYRVEALLGRGGGGEVFRATRDGAAYALKRLLGSQPDGRPTEAERKRLKREVETLSRLEHPHVVRLRDQGEVDGTPFLVFDLIEGETLTARLARGGPEARRDALFALQDVAGALEAAHRLGVVHRDVKPNNILLRPGPARPEGVLVDFGLARATDSSTLTRDGDVLGTPAYMAPEQADGRAAEAGPASDVYGLGAVLYHVLTGAPPFAGDGLVAVLRAIVDEPPRPPRALAPQVDPALEALALEALAKAPADRPASAAAFAERLAAATGALPAPADYWSRNLPTLALIGAGGLLYLTVLAFHLVAPAPRRAPPTPPEVGDAEGHVVDPIDAALANAEHVLDRPTHVGPAPSTTPDPEATAAETPAQPAGPTPPPAKTAARVHCHECGRKQQRADENFCPTCAIAYVCGACGEARTAETGAACRGCGARFE